MLHLSFNKTIKNRNVLYFLENVVTLNVYTGPSVILLWDKFEKKISTCMDKLALCV